MQIVIDIPEEDYEYLKLHNKDGLYNAILNGTPLPKNHGDLIDVNRKITIPVYNEQYEEWGETTMTVLEALNKWSDEGVKVEDVVIPADTESE